LIVRCRRPRLRRALAPLCALLLASCATVNEAPVVDLTDAPPRPRAGAAIAPGDAPVAAPGTHVVARGDTLYGIAFRHGLDFRQLAEWNRVPPPFTIRPGQVLRLSAPMVPADAGNTAAPRMAAPLAREAGPAGAAAAEAEDDTIALGSPDWNDDVPPEGEARTFGIDNGGPTVAAAAPPADTIHLEPATGAATAGASTAPAAPTREPAVPAPAAPAEPLVLNPAPDGAMPPPLPRTSAPAAGAPTTSAPAGPAPRPASEPAPPAGALARAVGVSPASAPTRPLPPPAPVEAAAAEPAPPPAVAAEPVTAPPDASDLAARSSDPPARIADGPMRAAGGVRWRWPADGTLVGRFAPGDPARQGIDLRGREGAPVVAAADGEVVYSGNGLVGYGELIIIKHSAEFLSAYGHNRRRLVAEGERVRAGQPIAEMGRAPNGFDALHFEIRRAGRPTDPLQFLPAR
jgi:lipoprotein NlpD